MILLVGAALGRRLARRRLRRFPVAEREQRTAVPVHAYAFLCGGRRRTAQTAMTALHLAGLIEVRRGRIVRTGANDDGLARVLRRPEPSAWQPDDPAGLGGL
ncbi:TIGR04222 domain-containing membrane protein [Streptomyces uncialis]|uniref:TIGR04222 domain-containing membrane protein n=1 Tax=Streptomyces uncialis TaxID=1048205 RepID=UPI0037F12E16